MQQTNTIKKNCTLCHCEDLLTVGSAPSAAGERIGMLRCADCHSYVPDYFAEWEQASLLASQLELHEGMWKEESDDVYLAGREEQSALVGTLLEGVEIKPGQRPRVLELGAGRGWLSAAFKQAGCDVVGVEPSKFLMDKARRVFSMDEEYVNTTAAEFLANCTDQFDVIVMWHVIEHIDKPLDIMKQACQKLAPGGIFAIQTPLPLQDYVYQEHLFFPIPSSFAFISEVLELPIRSIEMDAGNAYIGCIFGGLGCEESVPYETDLSMIVNQYHQQMAAAQSLAEERLASIDKMGSEIFELEQACGEVEFRLKEEKQQKAAAQSLAEERLASIDKMGSEIFELEQLCGEVEFRLKEEKYAIASQLENLASAEKMAKERYAAIEAMKKDNKRILENLASAESMAKERYAAIQEMGDKIAQQAAENEQYSISLEEARHFSYLLKLPYRRLRALVSKNHNNNEGNP